jgi:two-component system, NtrC family, sensor histidine kinase PilS
MGTDKVVEARPSSFISRLTGFFPVVALTLGLVVGIFLVFAIIDRLMLADADTETLRLFYRMRDLLSSLFAAFFVGWMTIRRSPPLLPKSTIEERWNHSRGQFVRTSALNYAQWFVQMRWFVIVVAQTVIIVSVLVIHILPMEVFLPLTLTVAFLGACNLAYSILLKRGSDPNRLLLIQVYADLVILTVLLHFSGGIENPLTLLMLLHVILGGVVLTRRQCFMVAIFASLLLGGLAFLEVGEFVKHYTLQVFPHFAEQEGEIHHVAHQQVYVATRVSLHALILLLVAYFVTTLAERLRDEERQLEKMVSKAMQSQQLLERSLETTGTSLRILDRKLRTRWANKRWRATFGDREMAAETADRAKSRRSVAAEVLKSGVARTSEIMVETRVDSVAGSRQSHRRIVQVTTAPVVDLHGRVRQVVELGQDVTEQKQAHAQLIRAGQFAAVGELAGHVAHEINNPIGIISAKARLLLFDQRDDMSEQVADEIEKVIDLADRVASIAKGLLSASRPSTAQQQLINLREPVQRALSMIHQRATRAGIRIEENFDVRLPPVFANAQEIEQVFLNILLNAIDAMPDGGHLSVRAEKIEVADTKGIPWIIVIVSDTGVGVSAEVAESVFDPFFTTKGEAHGTGLGLAICQGILRSHGGRIRFESTPGTGTRVSVMFPAGGAEGQADGEVQGSGG